MAVAPSPYKYLGNTAPVKNLNVPKKAAAPAGTKAYNPAAYVPGGSSALVAGAIQSAGYERPGANPVYVPQPAVTAPVAGGGGGASRPASTPGYWFKPDYAGLLAGDWEPEEAAIAGQKQKGENEAAFQLALRRAFIDYGGSADKLDDKFRKYIDDPTIEAAKNNKFSTMAQNLQAQTKALANQRAQLAARGMTRSGANTGLTKRALEARELADYAAGRTFTGGAEEGLSGLAKTEMEIANSISAAKARAAARIAEENPQTWVPGSGPDYEGESAYTNEVAAPPPAAAPPKAAAPAFGGIVGTKKLPNGSTVTTYGNGRQVQQFPGKSPYVINQGR